MPVVIAGAATDMLARRTTMTCLLRCRDGMSDWMSDRGMDTAHGYCSRYMLSI